MSRRFIGAALVTATALLAAVSQGRSAARRVEPRAVDKLEGVRSALVLRRDEPLFIEPSQGAARRGAAERGARLPVFEIARGGGCSGRWFSVGPLAWICEDGAEASGASPPPEQPRSASGDGLPFDYYFVSRDGSFGYRDLLVAEEGVPETQLLPGFGVAITREEQKPGGERYGLSTHGFWIPLRDLGRVTVPVFRGGPVDDALNVAWVSSDKVRLRKAPGGHPLRDVVPRQTQLSVLETREQAGKTWLRVGEQEWLLQSEVARPSRLARPAEVKDGEHWFDVELASQIVTAYVGDHPVFATLASTGRGPQGSDLATPKGQHRIWVKLHSSDMDNLENLEESASYAIQAVPWVMYFQKGYGLHGTFWHRAFGRVQSHGCVNLSPIDAEQLFDFASPRLPSGWTAALPTVYEQGSLVRVR
ncbi:MAG TPA: L,D-transpeptidase [Polyangiaceae bacterium]|nr:L,D-transpeptidase [Polyangiaceae bacterium]